MLATLVSLRSVAAAPLAGVAFQAALTVDIVAPDDGEILDGVVTLQANVAGVDPLTAVVEFFYDPHEDDEPEISLGLAALNPTSGFFELVWDTTTVPDTFNDIDTDGDDVEDTTVNITKPPTQDGLRVAVTSGADTAGDAIEIRIQNMLTVRFTLPDNTEDLTGFTDLEAVVTGAFDVTGVRFDIYSLADVDQRILIPFGQTLIEGDPGRIFSPIENAHYGRPLGAPDFPTGTPLYEVGAATPQGARRWVLRNWDTTTIPDCPPPPGEPLPAGCVDGTFSPGWALVATATDSAGRVATYVVEIYVINDLRVVITAPDDGANVSRFVALEARTSSMTGADNALAGGLWPATAVTFDIGGLATIPATEIPAGSGRWRAVWNSEGFAPGPYTITAEATNANPLGPETATYSVDVNLVDPGDDLAAFFPFDWGTCYLFVCSFLDGSSGATSWFWEFGDGNTSTDQLPTHTYATYGVYTVRLTVSNDGGVTTETYERVIPVGNTGVVGFNVNSINDLPLDDPDVETIDWTSAFKNFEYNVGDTLAIPVMWMTSVGNASFNSMPTEVCDDDEASSNQTCVIFTPEEAVGTAPTVVGLAQDGVLFTMEFTEVQLRGVTDIFKGKANVRIVVDVDVDGDGATDQTNQLGTNVDVTNSGVEGDETRVVAIISPFEGQFVGGIVPITAGIVSSVNANQVEFFVNGTSIGVDTNGADGWSVSWDTTTGAFPDAAYQLTATADFTGTLTTSAVRTVTVENAVPTEPPAPDGTFQIGRANDTTGQYITFPFEIEEEGGGGPPVSEPTIDASMTAELTNLTVIPGGGVIGGDALVFDVVITNTSPAGSGAVLTAFAFQSKFSESPALASRIGDKLFYAYAIDGTDETDGPMGNVKKNGTSNGLFSGRWKGICINSSIDFLPEFNAGLNDETLECAGSRADLNGDGEPELLTAPLRGLLPGQSQTVTLFLDSGTTDGALHVVEPGTLRGRVVGNPIVGPNGFTYFVPTIDNTGITDPNVVSIPDFADNKVLADADGTFNPTFAPAADNYTFDNQIYLTLPRVNFAFTDILGRNHTCGTYGLDLIPGIPCSGNPGASPVFGFLDTGDLVPGVENFAAILHGFGEYVETGDPEDPYAAPNYPYGVPCVNPNTPDGLRCGARPFTPIAEFYASNPDGTVTRQMVAGSYGELGSADQYTASIASGAAEDWKEEVIPELDPGGPCDPVADPDSRRPACAQLRTSATGQFYDLVVSEGAGINGGDVIEFTIDITNTSTNPNAYLTAFNYQTKQRGLADIGILDGFTQDRRDIRVDSSLPNCTSPDQGACWNELLGVGHFPNVIGNGLLFGQMVWQSGRIDRAGEEIVPDFVAVDPVNGIDPVQYQLESVKKNGPFSPILKGNVNFICVKSGLFFPDQDADASCAGVPAILIDPEGEPIYAPGELRNNVSQRLGLAPGVTQSVRIRMEFGDFRGAMLQILQGTLNAGNVNAAFTSTEGLARFFDCEDQRELEFCHPFLVGENINYLPNTTATWLTPDTLEEIEYVIINQPGDAPRIMNFQENFGEILAMAGFVPSAEFYAPDPNPALVGTPYEGILIRQQVLGEYEILPPIAELGLDPIGNQTTNEEDPLSVGITADTNLTETVTFSLLSAPSFATLVDNGDNTATLLLNPGPDDAGSYDATITATVGTLSASETFTILVVEPNTAPLADDDAYVIDEDVTLNVNAADGVLSGDTDADSEPLTAILDTTTTNGTLTFFSDGSFSYVPNAGFNGEDSFTYFAFDGIDLSNAATVIITVNAVNIAPAADNDAYATDEDTALMVPAASGVLNGDSDADGDTLSAVLVSTTNSGVLILNDDGSFNYNPNAGFSGIDSFTYSAYDGTTMSNVATVTITVSAAGNNPPSLNVSTASVEMDEGSTATRMFTASDPDGNPITVTASAGNVNNLGGGSYEWVYETDDGPALLTVTLSVNDGAGGAASADFDVIVHNVAPTATFANASGAITVGQNAKLAFSNQVDASHADTDAGFLYSYDCTNSGSFIVSQSDSPKFHCPYHEAGIFTARGRIEDHDGGYTDLYVEIVVNKPANSLPVAVDDTAETDAGVPVVVHVLDNDYDPDGDELTIIHIAESAVGTAVDNGDGTITFTPNAGFTGEMSFSYTISDGQDGEASATVHVTVKAPPPANQWPIAHDDTAETQSDMPVVIHVLANDSDPDGDSLTITGVSSPANGSAHDNGDGTITFTPNAGFSGEDSFIYIINDGHGGEAAATIFVTVSAPPPPPNQFPIANDDMAETESGVLVVIEVLANDHDPDGDQLTIITVSPPANGTAVDNGDGTVTYTSNAGFSGEDSFAYIISDGRGGENVATVHVTVKAPPPVNNRPIANDDLANTSSNVPVEIDVLVNDHDPDGDSLTIIAVSPPDAGTVVNNGNGTVSYMPNTDFHGSDSFSYTISDGRGGEASATVHVTVNAPPPPGNNAPAANDDTAETKSGVPVVINVLANDSDSDGDNLTIIAVLPPDTGTVVNNGNGTVTFTSDHGFVGPKSFGYTISDGRGGEASATVHVTVNAPPPNNPPVANTDTAETKSGVPVVIAVLANDYDPDGDPLTIIAVLPPDTGTVANNGNGTVTFTSNAGFKGQTTFSYLVSDGRGGEAAAHVVVKVEGLPNNPPVAVDDTAETDMEVPVVIHVLDNDHDPDGDPLTIVHVSPPAMGTVVQNGDGTITFTPAAGFSGQIHFSYTISDGHGGQDSAHVLVTVKAPPAPPPPPAAEWDRSSLEFGSKHFTESVVSVELCNVGDGDMAGPVPWQLYLSAEGKNPMNGEIIASGEVTPLGSGDCTTLVVDIGPVTGTCKFRSVQRPGHPPGGELPIWSD